MKVTKDCRCFSMIVVILFTLILSGCGREYNDDFIPSVNSSDWILYDKSSDGSRYFYSPKSIRFAIDSPLFESQKINDKIFIIDLKIDEQYNKESITRFADDAIGILSHEEYDLVEKKRRTMEFAMYYRNGSIGNWIKPDKTDWEPIDDYEYDYGLINEVKQYIRTNKSNIIKSSKPSK